MKLLGCFALLLFATSCQVSLKNESHRNLMSARINPAISSEIDCSPISKFEIEVTRDNSSEIIRTVNVALLINGEEYIMNGPESGFGLYTLESCAIPHDGTQRFRYRLTYEKGPESSPPPSQYKLFFPLFGYLQESLLIMAMGITKPINWTSPDIVQMSKFNSEYNGMSAILTKNLDLLPVVINPLISVFYLSTELPFENVYVYRVNLPHVYLRESNIETTGFIIESLNSKGYPVVFPYEPDENGQKTIGFNLKYNSETALQAGLYKIKIVLPLETIISSSEYTIWADITVN